MALLHDKITSFEQLEILLLLRRRREEKFTAAEIAQLLPISDSDAEEALDHLRRHAFLSIREGDAEPRFLYDPSSSGIGETVEKLALTYAENPLAIIKQMSSNALERVRTEAIRTFADAFLIGKGKKTDG